MSYFSPAKNDRDLKAPLKAPVIEPRPERPVVSAKAADVISTVGHGMVITGNIVTTGAVQVFGRVTGDIQAAQVTIREGAKVDGNVTAQEAAVQGTFKGTIRANSVRLHATAVVEGEVFNKLLTVEENALFEGVSRRLECPVSAPSLDQPAAEAQAFVPVQPAFMPVQSAYEPVN